MNVTLAQIRAFERIVRLGSFHAAARDLCLSQPSVSQRIRELEGSLGVQLFVRRGPRISLTADGTALITYADRLLGTTEEMVGRFRASDRLSGFLRIGVTESFGMSSLSDVLKTLTDGCPALEVNVQVGDTATISRQLNDHELDVAIISEPDVGNHIQREQIGVTELAWFAGANADIPPGPLSPSDIADLHIVVTQPETKLYATTTRWFAQAGAAPTRMSTCNSLAVNIHTIIGGAVVGIIPVLAMQDYVAAGVARQIRVTQPVPGHSTWFCYQARGADPALVRLVDLVRDAVSHYQLVA